MYAKKACELVKEFSSSESGQLSAFNVSSALIFNSRVFLFFERDLEVGQSLEVFLEVINWVN